MVKKTLLKNTYEFLEKNFSENIFYLKKYNKKRVNVLPFKGKLLKNKLLKIKLNFNKTLKKPFTYNTILKNSISKSLLNNKLLEQISLKNISFSEAQNKNANFTNLENNFFIKKNNNSLFSMDMIKSEFEKKQTRNSYFKNKLKEKKNLSILYGNISSNLIKKKIHKACKISKNYTFDKNDIFSFFDNKKVSKNSVKNLHKNTYKLYTLNYHFITLLESRLDVILYRAKFFPTIKSAKKWISYSRILVNSKCINIPSYILNFGDIVSIKKKNKKILANNILKFYIKDNVVNINKKLTKIPIKKNNLFSNFLTFNLIYYWFKCNLKNKINALQKKKNVILCNKFYLKNRYLIPNFYFILLKNQIKPINKFLLSLNINKLFLTYKINLFLNTQIYAEYETKKNLYFFFEKHNLNNKFEILLNIVNRKIIIQFQKIITSLLNNNFYKAQKNDTKNIITKQMVNNVKKYDLLFFLKLKKFFFASLPSENKYLQTTSEAAKNWETHKREKKTLNNFKPLNLEISYKTLTIIHLYPSQKIIFPCSLDLAVLTKNFA